MIDFNPNFYIKTLYSIALTNYRSTQENKFL